MNARAVAGAAVATAVFAASTGWSGAAGAAEHEHHLGLDLGGSALVIQDKSTASVGGTLGVHYTYELSDEFDLMAETAFSLVALDQGLDSRSTPRTFPAWLANADVGVAYIFDVLRWVPYAGVLVGGYALGGGTIEGVRWLPGAAVALGLDYRFTENLSAGLSGQQHFLSETATYPSFTQAMARIEYVWGR